VDNNPDPQIDNPDTQPPANPPEPAQSLPNPESGSEYGSSFSPPPASPMPPPGLAGPEPVGIRSSAWGRRLAAGGAALAILVGVGFAGYRLGNGGGTTAATQPIPKPAASSGVTAKAGTLNVSAVTAKVEPGVVDITAVDGYGNSTSAGTGMVLTSSGEVLTNNHVIDGATSITAQVDGVGTKYTAKVIGYDPTSDVALLQLENVSGLHTITVGNSSSLEVGLPVVAIGNALDLPGRPTVTSGAITALNRAITASDQGNASSENLTGLVQSDASLCSGNSGGPLANSAGQVIAMNTAAATDSSSSCSTVAFSIPINRALAIASQIQQGQASSTVRIGLPAFIGIDVADASSAGSGANGLGGLGQFNPPVSSGALVTAVLPQTAAQSAGLVAGDVITAANGTTITSESTLKAVVSALNPGQTISLTWVDSSDKTHTASVTLGSGPAG